MIEVAISAVLWAFALFIVACSVITVLRIAGRRC